MVSYKTALKRLKLNSKVVYKLVIQDSSNEEIEANAIPTAGRRNYNQIPIYSLAKFCVRLIKTQKSFQ